MRRLALTIVVAGISGIALAYGTAWNADGTPTWGIWLMITGTALLMSGMLGLAASRAGVTSRRAALLAMLLFLVLLLGFGLPMVLGPEAAAGPLILGLPLRVAIEIYGVGLLPALLLPLAFAVEFRDRGLDPASLDRLREECERLRQQPRSGSL